MSNTQTWYIVKHNLGNCEIIPSEQVGESNSEIIEQWGPFESREDAIARRIGLIRSGKCQPQ
ncbi:transposase [Anabaena azotica]|uniref:Transposase n=1 Tax=Anabaena azotica FACHB-119 TaxID=947527 RepID=A0ABR8CY52_9NOST|nr:transposase [Anabaena azotica]MBD2499093.1 transposase [Anabaena azotica FACHB-119]